MSGPEMEQVAPYAADLVRSNVLMRLAARGVVDAEGRGRRTGFTGRVQTLHGTREYNWGAVDIWVVHCSRDVEEYIWTSAFAAYTDRFKKTGSMDPSRVSVRIGMVAVVPVNRARGRSWRFTAAISVGYNGAMLDHFLLI